MPTLVLKDHQEDRGKNGVYDTRNALNDLTGKQWLFSTKTIIPKAYPPILEETPSLKGFSPLPHTFCQEIIETFTKPGETILDPFAGVGSTLFGNYLAKSGRGKQKRIWLGIETNEDLIEGLKAMARRMDVPADGILIGDPKKVLTTLPTNSVGLVFSDIPVWEGSSSTIMDPGKLPPSTSSVVGLQTIQRWLSSICPILLAATSKLKERGYLVLAIPRTGNSHLPSLNFTLSSLIAHNLQFFGIQLKAERIWFVPDPQKEVEEFRSLVRRILVFRKEGGFLQNRKMPSLFFKEQLPIGPTEIIHKAYPPSFNHKLRSQHGGIKPPELAQLLIEKYSTHHSNLVLDPFVGVGGTLLGASLSGRRAIGIDINKQWQEIYYQVTEEEGFPAQDFIVGDSRKCISEVVSDGAVDLILTDVPYWAMDKLKKTRGRYSRAGEESKEKLHSSLKKFNQTTIISLEEWKTLLRKVFTLCYPKLAPNKYCVVFIGNMYRTIDEHAQGKTKRVGRYLLLSTMLAQILLDIGYRFEREIIWYSPDKSLHVFGYPYSYIPSIVHQSILVFQKSMTPE